jgi:hypothetical protein
VLPCKGDPGAAKNLMDPNLGKKKENTRKEKCIALEQSPVGGLQLVNICKTCKAALIERQFSSNIRKKRQAYKIFPNLPLAVPQLGASQISLLAEVNCP